MRKPVHLLMAIALLPGLLSSCSGKQNFTLKGELNTSDSSDEPILVIYDDPEAKLDTIYPKKGKFTYMLSPDTLTLMRLANRQGEIIPIFADKGWEVQLKGTFSQPELKGTGANLEYQEFLQSIAAIRKDEKASAKEAEKFIQSHPQSVVSAYLLDRYFIQQPHPDVRLIQKLIKPLSGTVKDSRILSVAMKALPSQKASDVTYLSYYSCKDRNGKYISWNSNDRPPYTLVNFWASWSETSLSEREKLKELVSSLAPQTLKILNVSLDIQKEKWLDQCKPDTTSWIETCDFKGWENQLVKQHHIDRLPANILIDKNRKIIDSNLTGEQIRKKIQEDKDKESKKD